MNEIQAVGAGKRRRLRPHRKAITPRAPERPVDLRLCSIAPSAVVANGVVQGGVLAYLLSQQGIGSMGQGHI